ncbi:hypothetical protein C0995_003099 [Termitomyces sp. Mi166|nr:hypothetical protein C0995_003099 [Termitomyces sp. Mi166\
MVVAGKHELYNDLDEKKKAQVLSELLSVSEVPSALEMLGGKGKGKAKVLAAVEKEEEEEEEEVAREEFSLLKELLPKPMDVVQDEGLEKEVILSGDLSLSTFHLSALL